MILDFDLKDVMKLSNIKRWSIIEMSRDQSVAEHSYNVAMIAMAICNGINPRESFSNPSTLHASVLEWSLVHDLPEVITGDIPTPLKQHVDLWSMENKLFPKYVNRKGEEGELALGIVKIADYVDAIQFASKFCVDVNKHDIMSEMVTRMHVLISSQDQRVKDSVNDVLSEIDPILTSSDYIPF